MEDAALEAPNADQSRVSGPALDSDVLVSDKKVCSELQPAHSFQFTRRIHCHRHKQVVSTKKAFGRHEAVGFDRDGPWMLDKTGNASAS